MLSFLKNIIVILVLVILLPFSVFIAYEVGSLSENEEILETVYREQLDAIIFSINQYSADILDFYLKQIDYQWNQSGSTTVIDATFLQQNLAIKALIVQKGQETESFSLQDSIALPKTLGDSLFHENQEIIERLSSYKEAGYIKPELLTQLTIDETLYNVIMIVIGDATPCLLLIDPIVFIEDLLSPKIQQIAAQELLVAIQHFPSAEFAYGSAIPATAIIQKGDLTILKDFEISVTLLDQSIEELINARTKRNLTLLVILIVLVLTGIALVIRNVRKEVILSKAKSDFVANVSHEIRTPLSLISMFNETLMLGRVKEEEKKQEYYEIIFRETSRLSTIINKILSFSQMDSGKKRYNLEKMDPNEIILEVIESYSHHLKEKGFSIETDLVSTAQIKADKAAFAEMIINLIDNSIKYSQDKKHLLIRTFNDHAFIIIEMKDKGIGIAKNDQKRIFEKFYRVEGGDIHNTKGTGLGLSLVLEIVKAHNGRVSLTSELGKGSTFSLVFPIE